MMPTNAWLPASWLYILTSWKRRWASINLGDRIFVGFVVAVCCGLLIRGGVSAVAALTKFDPNFALVGSALYGVLVVLLVFTLPMCGVRRASLFRFIPENTKQRASRILAEFVLSCSFSAIIIGVIFGFGTGQISITTTFSNLIFMMFFHFSIYLLQWLLPPASATTMASFTGRSSARRDRFAGLYANRIFATLPKTSSRFLLKANGNLLVWIVVALVIVSGIGAAITLPSFLIGISTLSQALMIWQLALAEPRVGNGAALGAHSRFMPIDRAWRDFVALCLPHLALFFGALVVIASHKSGLELAIAVTQLVLSFWLIWVVLVTRAQNSARITRNMFIFGTIAAVAGQSIPPLIFPIAIIGTMLTTRDLMKLSKVGAASWPR